MDYNLLVMFLQCCTLSSVFSSSTIILNPQNTVAIEGGNTKLHCTVQNLGGNTVVWRDLDSATEYSVNRTIVAPQSVQPDRYTVTGDDTKGTFNLEITELDTLIDDRRYQCVIMGINGEFINASKEAELTVYKMPTAPICLAPEDIVEGDCVTFECKFESTIPQVEITLTRNGNTSQNSTEDPDPVRRYSSLSTLFNVTSEDNDALLRCFVDHPIFTKPYKCSATLNVMYPPIVNVNYMDVQPYESVSFTCDAESNPNATQFKWSLCLANNENDSIYLGNGTQLTIEPRNLRPEELVAKFDSNASCYNCTTAKTNLSVLFSTTEKLTTQEKIKATKCSLKCSVKNSIGEGKDEYNTVCVIENRSIIAIIINGRDDPIPVHYYIVPAGGIIALIICIITIIHIIIKKKKTAPVQSSVTTTPMTPYSNNVYNESCGNQKINMYYENESKSDEGNIPSKNLPVSTPEKDDAGDAQDRDTLPTGSRRKPEGDVKLDAMVAGPQYAVVNKPLKSSSLSEPPPDLLKSENGVKYTSVDFSKQPQPKLSTIKGTGGSTAYAKIDYNTQP